MSDLYTCRVCGFMIHLDNLTEHVLLHEEYSAFTYNESTKIIEPLINDNDEEAHNTETFDESAVADIQYTDDISHQDGNANFSTFPASSTLDDTYTASRRPTGSTRHLTLHQGHVIEHNRSNSDNHYVPNDATSVPHNTPYNIGPVGSLTLDSVQSLTGIRMIANAADSFSKKADDNSTLNYNGIGDIDGQSNEILIQKPLNTGDIIDTICLPYIGTTGPDRLFCECSIVFNRFVTDPQQSVNDALQSLPECRNFYTHTYNENVSLEDIIDDEETESDGNEPYDDTPADTKIVKSPTSPRKNKVSPCDNRTNKVRRYNRTGRKGYRMDVYKYQDPLVKCDLQKELPKSVISDLRKDEAVSKYLESMTCDAENRTEHDAPLQVEQLSQTEDVSVGTDIIDNKNSAENNVTKPSDAPKVVIVQAKITKRSNETLVEKSSSSLEPIQGSVDLYPHNMMGEQLNNRNKHEESLNLTGSTISNVVGVNNQKVDCNTEDTTNLEDEFNNQGPLSVMHSQLGTESVYTSSIVDIDVINNDQQADNNGVSVASQCSDYSDSDVNTNSDIMCAICGNSFCSEGQLKEHRLACTPSKRKQNVLSSIHENIKANLENSICEEVETMRDGLFYCIICDTMLPAKSDLEQHMKDHKHDDVTTSTSIQNLMKPDGTYLSDDTPTHNIDPDYMTDVDILDEADEMDDFAQEVDDMEQGLSIEYKTGRKRRKRKQNSDPTWLKENVCKKRMKRGSVRREFICDNCGDSFDFVLECLKHSSSCMTVSHVLKCFTGCGYVFKTRSELDYHKNFCSRRITYLERVDAIVDKIKKSLCDNGLNQIDTEELYHNNQQWMSCRECELVFPLDELSVHRAVCKSATMKNETFLDNETPSHCHYCNKELSSEEKKKYHELVCKCRPSQKCDYCEFSCVGNKPMSEHLVNKHNVNPYKCDMCCKTFKLKGSLRSHVKLNHTNETFTCEYCGKSFLKQSVYRSHVSIQHEGFRYKCKYCDKPFKDKRTWMSHEKSHKGAYDFSCTLCKKTFNKSSKYKEHMKDLHSIDGEAALALNSKAKELRERLCTNVCNLCGEKFPLQQAYSYHMINEHGADSQFTTTT